jgi:hypothetical protein
VHILIVQSFAVAFTAMITVINYKNVVSNSRLPTEVFLAAAAATTTTVTKAILPYIASCLLTLDCRIFLCVL